MNSSLSVSTTIPLHFGECRENRAKYPTVKLYYCIVDVVTLSFSVVIKSLWWTAVFLSQQQFHYKCKAKKYHDCTYSESLYCLNQYSVSHHVYLSLHLLSLHLSVCMSICLSVRPSVCLSDALLCYRQCDFAWRRLSYLWTPTTRHTLWGLGVPDQ